MVEIIIISEETKHVLPVGNTINLINGNMVRGSQRYYFKVETTNNPTAWGVNGGKLVKYYISSHKGAITVALRDANGIKCVPRNEKDRELVEALKERFN